MKNTGSINSKWLLTLCILVSVWLVSPAVMGAVISSFTPNISSGDKPLPVLFTDTSTGSPTGWSWFFGDELYNQVWIQQTPAHWTARYYHTSVLLPDGSIVLMGGLDDTYEQLNDTWRSTDHGETWVRQSASAGWVGRYKHTSVSLPDGSIILMGGVDVLGNTLNDTWRSTDKGITWTRLNSSSGWTARAGHTSVSLSDGSIILLGGSDDYSYLNDTWRSIDNGVSWIRLNSSSVWTARSGHTSVVLPDGSIILIGGIGDAGTTLNDTWRSTDKGITWMQLNTSIGSAGRFRYTSVASPDNSIVIIGGNNDVGYLNDTWRSVDNGTIWTLLNSSSGWTARTGLTSTSLPDGSIVLMGGADDVGFRNDTWRFQPVGSSLQNPTHTYTTSGNYSVVLQAYNSGGYNLSLPQTITINEAYPPSVAFTATPTSGNAPLLVQFVDYSVNNPTTWNWSFGDGGYSTDKNTSHTYTGSGSYTVILNASNVLGFGNYSRIISVGPGYPVAQFTTSTTYGTSPLSVTFTDTSSVSGNTTWYWSFGDGNISTLQNPVHTYMSDGVYHVTLTVTDSIGVDTSDETIIYVSSSLLPLVNFIGSPTISNSAPASIQFTDLTFNINTSLTIWNWSFGDGNYSSLQNPVHTYNSNGQYSVTLVVTNSSMTNYTTKVGYITIGIPTGNAFANFVATPLYSATSPANVQFTSTSVCTPVCNQWAWDFNGDGSTDSFQENPSYTYTYPGNYSPKLIVSNGANSGIKIRNHYITVGPIYSPTIIPQPTQSWSPSYNNGSVYNTGGLNIDMANSTYLKYWLQNLTATGNFSLYGFALGIMAPIMHVFGFWIFLIIWGLYLFAVWVRSQDVTLPLIIGILTLGTFGLLFPKESLPVIIIMFVICGAIIITKLIKE